MKLSNKTIINKVNLGDLLDKRNEKIALLKAVAIITPEIERGETK